LSIGKLKKIELEIDEIFKQAFATIMDGCKSKGKLF
jgi:hypothetical protein